MPAARFLGRHSDRFQQLLSTMIRLQAHARQRSEEMVLVGIEDPCRVTGRAGQQ
jgi:hypothetical protein